MVTTAPVTIEQAAAILGVSASTIRRRIKAGTLRVEEARRPQGVVWLVHLPAGTAPAVPTDTAGTAPVTSAASTSQPAGDAIAAMIQATLTPIVAPLVAELAAGRQANERQAEQLVSQAETIGRQSERVAGLELEIGRLQAENRALVAQREAQSAKPTPEPSRPPRRAWWLWLVLLAPFIVTAIVVAVVLLALPRV